MFRFPPVLLLVCYSAAFSALVLPKAASADLRLREVAAAWNLEHRHHHGGTGELYMVETMGSGVLIFDFDDDGDQDVLLVDSGPTPGYDGEPARTLLLRNDGWSEDDGRRRVRFADVTERSGIDVAVYGMGATAGDVDGDGDLDLYVTGYPANELWRNRGDGTFENATAEAGVAASEWSASAAFGDGDGDGDLDLYVSRYVDFSWQKNPVCGVEERKIRSYCHPDVYNGLTDLYFRNRGDGTFEDATAEAGLAATDGKGLGVTWSDFDGDGREDIYVANDMTPNFLHQSLGEGKFEDLGVLVGTAVSDLGRVEAGMGIAVGDADGNLHPDLVVTHLDLQTNAFYGNMGGIFLDRRFPSKLGEASIYKVGFGTAFADFDHDGDLDLIIANGHIIHNVEEWGTGTTYKQRNQLFENDGKAVFQEIEAHGMDAVRSSRGLALGDLDGDGDLDVVITNSDDLSEAYANDSAGGRWLQVDVGIGTRAELEVGDARILREARTASSYLSQNATTLHFGLGDAASATLSLRRGAGDEASNMRIVGLAADRRVRIKD